MPSRSAIQAARNESLFRELNEHLRAASKGSDADTVGFVCECSSLACTSVIAISLHAYAQVREHPARFVVAPEDEHVDPTLERVVERTATYWVVEKLEDVAEEVAEEVAEASGEQPATDPTV